MGLDHKLPFEESDEAWEANAEVGKRQKVMTLL